MLPFKFVYPGSKIYTILSLDFCLIPPFSCFVSSSELDFLRLDSILRVPWLVADKSCSNIAAVASWQIFHRCCIVNFPSCILLSSAARFFISPMLVVSVSYPIVILLFFTPIHQHYAISFMAPPHSSLFIFTHFTGFSCNSQFYFAHFLQLSSSSHTNPTALALSASTTNARDTRRRSLGSSDRNPTSASGNH